MRNVIKNPNLNTRPLVEFELSVSDFTIVTGLNGAGKSRLINGIEEGKIQYFDANGKGIAKTDIQVIGDPGKLVPFQGGNPTAANMQTLMIAAQASPNRFVQSRGALYQEYLNEGLDPNAAWKKVYEVLSRKRKIKNDGTQNTLDTFLDETQKAVTVLRGRGFVIKEKDIPSIAVPASSNGKSMLTIQVPHSVGLVQLFEDWRRLYHANLYSKFLLEQNEAANFVEWGNFYNIHGKHPWRELNRLLETIGSELRFHIDETCLNHKDRKITGLNLKDEKGNVFPAQSVSTGERIIFLIVQYRYVERSNNISYRTPKLLLLDELDAHLHPSLSGKLLGLLKEVFIDNGTKILFSTHSPATVSLADEMDIVVLTPYEKPSIGNRREALNVLMSGQEKMFIDLSGSKIVFVEDSSDVEIFDALISRYVEPKHEQLLLFKSLSQKKLSGTKDGGKDTVKRIIDLLGVNKNIIGLIDYDGKETPKPGLFILCGTERYGIENVLLDPRILIYVLLRYDTKSWSQKFNIQLDKISDFGMISKDDIQKSIDKVEEIVGLTTTKNTVKYVDGKSFLISEDVLKMKCHDYEKVTNQKLRLSNKLTANFCKKIAHQNMPEIPGSMPYSLKYTFDQLLK